MDANAPAEGLSTDQMQALAESLKKRIDPVDNPQRHHPPRRRHPRRNHPAVHAEDRRQ